MMPKRSSAFHNIVGYSGTLNEEAMVIWIVELSHEVLLQAVANVSRNRFYEMEPIEMNRKALEVTFLADGILFVASHLHCHRRVIVKLLIDLW